LPEANLEEQTYIVQQLDFPITLSFKILGQNKLLLRLFYRRLDYHNLRLNKIKLKAGFDKKNIDNAKSMAT